MIFVLSGPSGVGKGSLVKQITNLAPALHISVSCTTRTKRPGEHDGETYRFLSRKDFMQRVANDEFAESADVYGNLYGTLKSDLDRRPALLEIDCQGARTIKQNHPGAKSIFILPPSYLELRRRLQLRDGESETGISKRLAAATEEIRQVERIFDFWLTNDRLDEAVQKLWDLMQLLHRGATPLAARFCCPNLLESVRRTFPSNTAN